MAPPKTTETTVANATSNARPPAGGAMPWRLVTLQNLLVAIKWIPLWSVTSIERKDQDAEESRSSSRVEDKPILDAFCSCLQPYSREKLAFAVLLSQ
jgi:hypothetical protein